MRSENTGQWEQKARETQKKGKVTYALHDTLTLTSPRNSTLPIRMNEFSHRRRTNKQRKTIIQPKNRCLGIDFTNIPQHPRPEPNTIKRRLVGIPGEQVRASTRVERPRLGTGGLGRHDLKVVRVDQCLQRRFLVFQHDLWIGARGLLDPVFVYRSFIQESYVFLQREL